MAYLLSTRPKLSIGKGVNCYLVYLCLKSVDVKSVLKVRNKQHDDMMKADVQIISTLSLLNT